jgi:hypothetical protein
MKRAALGVLAVVAWLVLVVLWLVWAVLVYVLVRRRRTRRRLTPDFPRLFRIRPGRAPDGPQRMSSGEKSRRLAQLVARDGLWCQECGLPLRLDVHHTEDDHPEVHHLVAWSICRGEWWANELFNLALLCQTHNRVIGAGTTSTLERLRADLWAAEGAPSSRVAGRP